MTPSRSLSFAVTMLLGSAPALARADASPAEVCATGVSRARSDHESGKLRSARDGYAACAREECPAEVRAECVRRRDEVEHALPTTSFVVTDAAGRDVDAKVTVDEATVPVTLGRAVALDPGVHDITWVMPDGARGWRKVTIVEGQKNRLVTLATGADGAAAAPPPPANTALPPAAPAEAQRTAWPWVIVGTGAALVVGAGFLQLLAVSEEAKSKERLNDFRQEDYGTGPSDAYLESAKSHHDAAQNNQAAAITLTAIGVGALVTGVTWLVVRDRSRSGMVQPAAGVRLGGARFGGTF